MKAAYCKTCKIVIGAGDLPEKVSMKDKKNPGTLKDVACVYSHTTKSGEEHKAVLVEIGNDPIGPLEKADAYHKRLEKAHSSKLNA